MLALRRVLLAATAASLLAGPALAQGPIVDAPAGKMAGVAENGLNVFKGIPYAEPPVGSLRWKPPQPLARWDGVKEATAFGPECFQPVSKIASVYSGAPEPMSEDCLTLNVWAPKDAHNAPVFFWIYGGALWGGASRDPLYNGAKLAEQGVIVVSINYRLGVLGWMASPALSAESPEHISGNYGLLDQIAALKWVKDNIASFGGDPANVTIAGESAGGLSVLYLMASPEARGLFGKAIAESAYMISTPELKKAAHGEPAAEAEGARIAAAMHIDNLGMLRAISPQTLTAVAGATGFQPFAAIDGHVLTGQIANTFAEGKEAHVPLLIGFNSGEVRSLGILLPKPPADAAEYESTIRARYGDLADQFLKLYPASNIKESMLATTRDALYGWTSVRAATDQTRIGQPAYLYFFDHGYPAEDQEGLHAFHASELPFVFGTLDATPPHWPKIPDTADQHQLSQAMIEYWTSFAKSGQPSAQAQPAWKPYGDNAAYMDFAAKPELDHHLLPGMYELNNAVVCRRDAAGNQAWNWNVGLAAPPLPPPTAACK